MSDVRAPNRALYRVGWRIHKAVWNFTGGRLGAKSVGMPVLELVTTGRQSGEDRHVLLTHVPHPDGWVVIGSNLGSNKPPAWWLNLQADPAARVRLAGSWHDARAEALDGVARDEYWSKAVAMNAGYNAYVQLTDRPIPVILLRKA